MTEVQILDDRVRGRIAEPAGWISMYRPSKRWQWVIPGDHKNCKSGLNLWLNLLFTVGRGVRQLGEPKTGREAFGSQPDGSLTMDGCCCS